MTYNHKVSISIIIPTCNRSGELSLLIDSLNHSLKYTERDIETEIIVSDDSNNNLSKKLINKSFPKVTWIKGPQNGSGANRNNGANLATKEWLLFIDDDCYVNEEFIEAYSEMMEKKSINVLEGKIICPNKKNSIFVRQPENDKGGVLASGNFAIKKSLFTKIGGFDEDFKIMEDIEFAARLKSIGESFMFCENAVAFHPAQLKSISFYLSWIFHFKWQLLLNYKNGSRNIKEGYFQSMVTTVHNHILFLLRITYHLITKFDRERWIM
jgi:GT2 family glycosyltransferase